MNHGFCLHYICLKGVADSGFSWNCVVSVATVCGFVEQAKTSDERYKKMRELYENLKQEHVTLLRNVSQYNMRKTEHNKQI